MTVRTANGVDYGALESVDTTLTQYLNGGSGDKISSFYAANNYIHPDLVPSIVLPDLGFPRHVFRLSDTRLWVSRNPGSGAAIHQDLQDNFVLMLSGEKAFFLRPPHEEHGAWSVTPFLRSGGGGTGDGSWMRADLYPGDLLYIPAGWWHATESTSSNTVSINFFMSACFAALV